MTSTKKAKPQSKSKSKSKSSSTSSSKSKKSPKKLPKLFTTTTYRIGRKSVTKKEFEAEQKKRGIKPTTKALKWKQRKKVESMQITEKTNGTTKKNTVRITYESE